MMWPFRRYRGMIKPNMGLALADSQKIAKRKSVAMVGYLRARRSVHDPLSPAWMKRIDLRALRDCRAAHLRLAKKKPPP